MNTEVSGVEQTQNEIMTYLEMAEDFSVVNLDTFEEAGVYLTRFKQLKKQVVEYFRPLKEAANKAHKELTQREKKELTPITETEQKLLIQRAEWKDAEDRRIEAERLKAEEAERKRVEAERERLLEEAAKLKDEAAQEQLLEKAEQTIEEPVFVPDTVAKTSVVGGVGTSTWIKDVRIECADLQKLCAGIAEGKVPVSIIEFKAGKCKAWVKSANIKPGTVPGLFIKEIKRESIRGV